MHFQRRMSEEVSWTSQLIYVAQSKQTLVQGSAMTNLSRYS